MPPKISIITPTYNHANFLSQCIQSVIDQTYTDWEQIIVDDGSTDSTKLIVDGFKDNRIKYIYQNNRGIKLLYETYNTALHEAKGELIAILEGDDYWPLDKLEHQIKKFEDKTVDLVWGKVVWVDIDANPVTTVPENMLQFNGFNRYQYIEKLLIGNFIPAVTVILRKDKLLEIGGFQQPYNMVTSDYPTWLEIIEHGEVAVVDAVVGFWRRHPTQMSTARQHEILNNTMLFAILFYEKLPIDIKLKLKINSTEISASWRKHISESCFYEGRKKLIRKEWNEAKCDFKNSFMLGDNVCKIKSILGMMGAYTHNNLERLVAVCGNDAITRNELSI